MLGGCLAQRDQPGARLRIGGRRLVHQRGVQQLRNVGDQRLQFGTNRAGNRLVSSAESVAGLDHEALQIEPGAAAGQRHCALRRFQQLFVLFIEQ